MVRRSPWAARLSPSDLEHVLGSVQERSCARGAFIVRAGQRLDHWLGLVEGLAKISVSTEDGRASTLTGVSPGVWFGEGSMLCGDARRYDVLALQPTRIALMPRRTFEWLRQTSLPFNHYLQDLLHARLRRFIDALAHERLLDTDARIAHCLASLFRTEPCAEPSAHEPHFLQVEQSEIGLMANVSRQRANMALQRFQSLQLIRIEKRGLTVLDLPGLRTYSSTNKAPIAIPTAAAWQPLGPRQPAAGADCAIG